MIVDDEQNILNAIKRSLRDVSNWEIEVFSSAEDALKRAQVTNFDLFLSDYRMPVMSGTEFLSQVKILQPDAMRMIISGYTDIEALLGAINEANIFRFITKPWDDKLLKMSIMQALELRDIYVENRRMADELRWQQQQLIDHKCVLEVIEENNPGLTKVNWADDGSIILNDDET